MTAGARRLIVFDPIGEWSGFGLARAESLDAVREHVARHWRSGFRVAYTPAGDYPRRLSHLADWLMRAQRACDGRRAPLLLVVDELSLSLPVHKLPSGQDAMMRACLQGRHYGLGLLGLAQRPATVSPDFRGQVVECWAFAQPSDLDRRAIAAVIGAEHADTLRTLPDHSFLHMAANGTVTRGRNARLPLRAARIRRAS